MKENKNQQSLDKLLSQWNRYFSKNSNDEKTQIVLKEKICFYGGTFNPWHDGHRTCIELFHKWDENNNFSLIVIPDKSPWKTKSIPNSPWEQYTQVQENIPGELVYPGFLAKDGPNPTVDWLEIFHQQNSDKQLSFLMGFDNFSQIHRWKRFEDFIKLLDKLFVVDRQNKESIKNQQIKALKRISPSLEIIFLGPNPYEKLSSTALRN
ncbi:MAG: hypothetical protein H6621_01455 [Halobacteriovoraceae bacterium]|nr:hypothetical protein [Halobacteriovoraceae bacterium]